VGVGPADDGIPAALRQPFDSPSPAGHPRGQWMHRLEGVRATAEVAFGQLNEQVSGGRHMGRQQRMGNHGDPALIVERS
jgi:hypothetical protein